MADKDFLKDRGKALEEQFFAKHNKALLDKIQEKRREKETREALSAASGITNEELLDSLIEQGINAETLAALSLAPLVLVAWSDGSVEKKEREAALRAAEESGLRPGDDAYALLVGWLENRPPVDLLASWRGYIAGFHGKLKPEMSQVLKKEILGRAQAVAEAAGGILGIGSVSKDEERMLQELERAFD